MLREKQLTRCTSFARRFLLITWSACEEPHKGMVLVLTHDGGLITTSVAVIGRREDRHHIPVLRPVVPLHDELMRSRHERQAIVVVEGL